MRYRAKLAAGVVVLGVAGVGAVAIAHERSSLDASLSGYQETPTLSTQANGSFRASINRAGDEVRYVLSYQGPFDAGSAGASVTQAHVHLGAPAIAGGIVAFLCTNLGNGPAGTPACPAAPATVTGTITPAQIVGGAATQGIQVGEFAELVRALRAGAAYANVHTTTFPAGEIRGQISDDSEHHGPDH